MVDELLKGDFDFTADEVAGHRPRQADLRQRRPKKPRPAGRKRLKYDMLVLKADKTPNEGSRPTTKTQERLKRRYAQLRQADAPDRQQRAAGDVPDGDHQRLRSAQHLHGPGVEPRISTIVMGLQLEGIGAQLKVERRLHGDRQADPRRRRRQAGRAEGGRPDRQRRPGRRRRRWSMWPR